MAHSFTPPVSSRRRQRRGACHFCERELALTFHHLIPKKLHRRVHYRRHYTRDELALGIHICRDCHNGIHRFYDEMHLAKYLNTPESLAADTQLKRHFAWVARQRVR